MLLDMEEKTGITPRALQDRPALMPELSHYLEVFWELSNSRQHGMNGPQPISLTEIWAYCQMFGWDTIEERTQLVHFIQQMDSAYFESLPKTDTESKSEVAP